ncbi:copper amine oxidase N-terminal domain-containing protein [uncultured Paenibacillus sp.]|uniref:copper amine oxidase N-terminal domain-containing protein n=1 Tax=uncultured Paenibacillus sp. TaxID=227322 RepID=UPI0028D8D450|nr:copper amine oxidase N-terminal domain-containing protein [uncultured Paenibacillus sp.]
MKKKWLAAAGLSLLVLSSVNMALADKPIKLFINGKEIRSDVAPYDDKGRVMVPIRSVAEALDADVKWDGKTNSVIIEQRNQPGPVQSTISTGSYLDAIMWGGVTYRKSLEEVDSDDIGAKIGEVKFQIVGSGKDPSYQMQDGDATFLPKGTVLHEVKNTTSIAASVDGKWILYTVLPVQK